MFSEKTSCTIIFFHYTCSMPIGYAFATNIDSIILFIHLTLDTNKNNRHMCICVVIDNDVMNQRKVHIQKKTSMTSRKRKYHFILMHYGRIFVISIVVKIWRFMYLVFGSYENGSKHSVWISQDTIYMSQHCIYSIRQSHRAT